MPGAPPVLQGREAPMRALRAGLESALVGRGQLAVVSGEPGIGKSAIAAMVAGEAEACGATVTWGRAWELAEAPPYFPVWPCLRALGVKVRGDEGQAFHLWEEVLGALARQSSAKPAVWIIEDLHAADLGTLDLLTFLAQPLRAMRVLVVVTARERDARLSGRAAERLTRMTREGIDVRLERLSRSEVAALTEQTTGRPLPAPALARLTELTGGNPLFVLECARAFKAAGGVEGTLSALPPTVRQVVMDRVTSLPDRTRAALACGAVLGREFSAAVVARMSDALPARIVDVVLPALRTGVITESSPGHFVFSHMLVRDAIDDSLGAEERSTLHGRAEAALGALDETAEILVERARHALCAAHPGQEERVLAIADRASALLEREGAFDRAFELHARVDAARRDGLLPPALPLRKLHVARIARAAGRGEVTRLLCQEVAAAARSAADGVLLAEAALLYGAELRPGIVDQSLVALLEEARAALGRDGETSGLGAKVLGRLAGALQPALDPNGPMEMARAAIRCAKATGDDAVILEVIDLAGSALVDFAPLEERIELATELLDRAGRARDRPKMLRAHARLAFEHVSAGDFAEFDKHVDSLLARSDELGHPRHRWRALLVASARAVTLGHVAESDRHVVEVRELAALTDDPAVGISRISHEIMRLRILRRDDELRSALTELDGVLEGVPLADVIAACVRATSFARIEDLEATRRELAVIGARAAMFDADLAFAAWMAEAVALAGTDDERRRMHTRLARAPVPEVNGGHIPMTYEGPVRRLLGLLAASLGDLASAESCLREAYDRALERRHLPWVAQMAHELAKVVRRAGREGEARTLESTCLTIARDLGMTGLSDAGPTVGRGASAPVRPPVTMALAGDVWTIARDAAAIVRVKDTRGMRLLARLVERPNEEVHVLTLASEDGTAAPESSAGDVLDERARKEYRDRASALAAELDEAERDADLGRQAKLRLERDLLHAELSRAVGLGGRTRQAGSASERARVNVQRRVKDAVARIAEVDAALGRFFERAVRTGTYCSFRY